MTRAHVDADEIGSALDAIARLARTLQVTSDPRDFETGWTTDDLVARIVAAEREGAAHTRSNAR